MAIVVVSVSHPQILAFLLYPLHKILAANGCNQNAEEGKRNDVGVQLRKESG